MGDLKKSLAGTLDENNIMLQCEVQNQNSQNTPICRYSQMPLGGKWLPLLLCKPESSPIGPTPIMGEYSRRAKQRVCFLPGSTPWSHCWLGPRPVQAIFPTGHSHTDCSHTGHSPSAPTVPQAGSVPQMFICLLVVG